MKKDHPHPEIGRRIADAMKDRGLSLKELAEPFGKTAQTAHNWKDGKHLPNPPEFLQLAELLKVNVVWLTTGKGPKDPEGLRDAIVIQNARGRLVPRLSLEDVSRRPFRLADHEHGEKVLTHFACGPLAFEIKVTDTSNAPEYLVGDSVIVDPDLRPEPGDMVLALVGTRAVFRKMVSRGGDAVELRPLNPDWHPDTIEIGKSGEIIGTMSEHAKPRRN